ncbi:PAS domain-containing protein [Ferrovibrio sp.]|uniref:PAS domain-containing protein n=1 Tax=Ferrovibrio sp. TaxID=1917215 RepID=UPI0025B9F2FC|nr:PAS domain-containing protein [Ferrovibrio sp.]MBX3453478.1 PAS domain-containing protein [Ferrovibrio sp.]
MVEDLDGKIARSDHPRMLGTGFLDICSSRVKRAFGYWDGLRGSRIMPARADIDPLQIPDLLPFVVLTEVLQEPPWLRYRLVGTRQVQMRGFDPTGRAVAGNHIGHHLPSDTVDEVLLNYWIVIGKRCPVYDYNSVLGPTLDSGSLDIGQVRERGTLLLPLGQDGETVDMVFCIADVDHA